MAIERRTISIPADLAKKVERAARKEGRSFSATLSELVAAELKRRARPRLRGVGIVKDGPGDLALRVEEVLKEMARTRDVNG